MSWIFSLRSFDCYCVDVYICFELDILSCYPICVLPLMIIDKSVQTQFCHYIWFLSKIWQSNNEQLNARAPCVSFLIWQITIPLEIKRK